MKIIYKKIKKNSNYKINFKLKINFMNLKYFE